MSIDIANEARKQAVSSIQRYFDVNMEDAIGNLGAEALLDFFLTEIGPLVYNRAVADVQQRLQARVMELDGEVYENEFQYWRQFDAKNKKPAPR